MLPKPIKKPVKPRYQTKHFLRTYTKEIWSADILVKSKTINPKPLLLPDVTSYQFYDQVFCYTGNLITMGKPKGFTELKLINYEK